ncbi:MAG: hypothetical protein GY832_23555 [Chloroflexi bacterium]|nr:hypothetical protein [Chloroflexota bacterium]
MPPRLDPRRAFEVWLVLLAFALIVALLLGSLNVHAEPLTDRLDAAIVNLLTNGMPSHNIGARPHHPMMRNPADRARLAQAIAHASQSVECDPWTMLAIAFREGSFTGHRTGKIGERSTFQITASAVRWARRKGYSDCTLDTVEGAALCTAAILHEHHRRCGTEKGAVLFYATGRTCKPDTKKLRWLARDRLSLAARLEGMQ